MQTYLLDILNRYNKFSEKLDVKTILCNKSWLVFNDNGNKELYIFQEKGSLIISVNGKVTNAKWQYISANKSIIISSIGQSYMFHPAFFDKNIFALQQDGTNNYAFMIDEKQSRYFHPKSLTELKLYFENIEHKRNEAELLRVKAILAQERARQKQIEEDQMRQEQRRLEQERIQCEEAKKLEEKRKQERERIAKERKEKDILKQYKIFVLMRILGYIIMIVITAKFAIIAYDYSIGRVWVIISPLVFILLYFFVYKRAISWLRNKILTYHIVKKKREKEEEWANYLSLRDQRDFDRIEKYRMEREKREKEEREKKYI